MKNFLQNIKVGDFVWMESLIISGKHKRIIKVDRLTDTIIISGNMRFKKATGIQKDAFSNYKIIGIATPQELEAYNVEQAENNRKHAEMQRERENEANHRRSLGDLFHNVRARVCTAEYDSGINNGPFDLVFNNIDEDLIRLLAQTINSNPNVKNNKA